MTRRYSNVREALARDGLDAAIVCGSEYTGFEGAVTYMSGFTIVHRYAYVLLPLEGDPAIVFPSEARYVGEHGDSWIEQQVFVDRPGEWLADRVRGQTRRRLRPGLRDDRKRLRSPAHAAELVPWDVQFDHARAVKSRRRARVGARQRTHQHGRLPRVPRGVRAGQDRSRADGGGGATLRRARLWSPDDEHGPRRRGVRARAR